MSIERLRNRPKLSHICMWKIGWRSWHKCIWHLHIISKYPRMLLLRMLLTLIRSIPSIIQSHHFVVVHIVHTFQIFLVVLISRSTYISVMALSLSGSISAIFVVSIESIVSSPIRRSSSLLALVGIFSLRFLHYLLVWRIVNVLFNFSCAFWL